MKTNNKVFQMGFVCPLKRGDLENKEGGYHCGQCQREVIDFTCKSKEEAQNLIKGASGKICGIIKIGQLAKTALPYTVAAMLGAVSLPSQLNAQTAGTESKEFIEEPEVIGELIEAGYVFQAIDKNAQPIGGWEAYIQAISKEMKLPKDAGATKSTLVFIQFLVDSTGTPKNYFILKGEGLEAADALRAIKTLDIRFVPGSFKGVPMESRSIVPIRVGTKKQ